MNRRTEPSGYTNMLGGHDGADARAPSFTGSSRAFVGGHYEKYTSRTVSNSRPLVPGSAHGPGPIGWPHAGHAGGAQVDGRGITTCWSEASSNRRPAQRYGAGYLSPAMPGELRGTGP